jgi:hypothetical protein
VQEIMCKTYGINKFVTTLVIIYYPEIVLK